MPYTIKKYIIHPNNSVRWLIVGKNREYYLTEYSCSCKSFQLLLSKRQSFSCKHLDSLKLSIKSGEYNSFNISIPEYQQLRKYLLNIQI